MDDEELIIIKDSLDIPQRRALLEVTNSMVRCINAEEFNAIMNIYGEAAKRLLSKGK